MYPFDVCCHHSLQQMMYVYKKQKTHTETSIKLYILNKGNISACEFLLILLLSVNGANQFDHAISKVVCNSVL